MRKKRTRTSTESELEPNWKCMKENKLRLCENMDIKNWQMLKLLDEELISKIKIACVFGTLGNEAIIVTKEDEVFSFGVNESGCLGLGDVEASLSPRKIKELCDKRVKGFAFGNGPFAVALTEDGAVYSWGLNNAGQVGNNLDDDNVFTPNLIGGELLGKQVIEVACGGSHTLALTSKGEVYFWGMNPLNHSKNTSTQRQYGYGQSNTNREPIQDQKAPKKMNFGIQLKKVKSIACGEKTSMALLENGELYGWGYDDCGQLGLGDNTDSCQPNPCWISSFKYVVITKVVCGLVHTLAMSDVGDLFAWGDNTYGQLGTGTTLPAYKPVRITSGIGRVVDIAAVHTLNLSAALTENFEVYMWGFCRGQNITKPLKTHFKSLNDVFSCCGIGTPTPVTVDMSRGITVAESMRKAFNDPKHSDLTMMVCGKPIYLHKAFLKIRCEHLETRFSERWQEGSRDVCKTDEYPYEVYETFLEYLYTDEVKLPVKNALGLLDLANSYNEEQLKKNCVEIITRGLTVENVASVYTNILKYDIKELEERCVKFSMNHMSAIIKTEAYKEMDQEMRLKLHEKTVEFGERRDCHLMQQDSFSPSLGQGSDGTPVAWPGNSVTWSTSKTTHGRRLPGTQDLFRVY